MEEKKYSATDLQKLADDITEKVYKKLSSHPIGTKVLYPDLV